MNQLLLFKILVNCFRTLILSWILEGINGIKNRVRVSRIIDLIKENTKYFQDNSTNKHNKHNPEF
jgi:uncharacterized membrane protein YciS (DUF1049 family)